jgi:hypothetical protein
MQAGRQSDKAPYMRYTENRPLQTVASSLDAIEHFMEKELSEKVIGKVANRAQEAWEVVIGQ